MYYMAVYLSDAYKTEMSTYIPICGWINEGSKVTMNPMATWGTATTAAKLFKELINWPFDFDDEDYFQGGAYNDQLKAKIHLVQLVPGLSMAYRVANLSESNRYYKLFTL